MINESHGGVVIAAWEVDQLPDTWIDAFAVLRDEMPEMVEHFQRVERERAKWRREHPQYGKMH